MQELYSTQNKHQLSHEEKRILRELTKETDYCLTHTYQFQDLEIPFCYGQEQYVE